jgi:hypothetical protein
MVMALLRGAIGILALLVIPAVAWADDISATGRSVVRVVTVTIEDDQVTDFGHGSGFAVSRNRILTNAHVVAAAARDPDSVGIGIVPSQGSRAYAAHIVAFDPEHDLALVEMNQGALPPATFYLGPLAEGSQVVALGYPGNVDMATARSMTDFITPQQPARSVGNYSNARLISDIPALLHTASMAHGNSGGPLLDPCGRVIGVNSFVTNNENGDSPFGFAIAGSVVGAFLNRAGQSFSQTGGECVSMADRLKQEQDRSTLAKSQADAAAREESARTRQAALARDQAANQDSRENRLAFALILGVLGVAGLGAGGLMLAKDRGRDAAIFAAAGVALLLGGTIAFLSRPSRDDIVIPEPAPVRTAAKEITGPLLCRFQPERSRVTVSSTADIPIEWHAGGCMNRRTQYARSGSVWTRILVPRGEDNVQALQYDPASREYVVTRYLLGEAQMAQARALRPQLNTKTCTSDSEAVTLLDDRQSQIRAVLPKLPNERLVFQCEPR